MGVYNANSTAISGPWLFAAISVYNADTPPSAPATKLGEEGVIHAIDDNLPPLPFLMDWVLSLLGRPFLFPNGAHDAERGPYNTTPLQIGDLMRPPAHIDVHNFSGNACTATMEDCKTHIFASLELHSHGLM